MFNAIFLSQVSSTLLRRFYCLTGKSREVCAQLSSFEPQENAWCPNTEHEKQLVRAQLEKLLLSPHFRSSKRYPGLLRFVVEQALEGKEDSLKERTLGIEVFHRAADYDTSLDPVVRMTAVEVRKRIAEYYQQPEHQNELKIELHPGSYIPLFYRAEETPALLPLSASEVRDPAPPPAISTARSRPSAAWLYAGAILAVLSMVIGTGVYFHRKSSVTDKFWYPIISAPGRATLCIGEPDDLSTTEENMPPASTIKEKLVKAGHLALDDVVTLVRAGAALDNLHKPFRITTAVQTNLSQLREGPVVTIGALDNAWTMRLTEPLRFGFLEDHELICVLDHNQKEKRDWCVRVDQAPSLLSQDFAIIARYHDLTLDQPVVIAGGLSVEGTAAVGEMLSDPNALKVLFQNTHKDWRTVNFEAVLQTQVIDGHSGPPKVLAVEYW